MGVSLSTNHAKLQSPISSGGRSFRTEGEDPTLSPSSCCFVFHVFCTIYSFLPSFYPLAAELHSMSNSTALSRPLDSPLNHGPVVNVITWFLLVTSALSVLARLGTSLAISRGIGWDDYMILISLVSLWKAKSFHLSKDYEAFQHRPNGGDILWGH